MKLYLSSFRVGDETETLKSWLEGTAKKVGYIPNAVDFTTMPPANRVKNIKFDLDQLASLGLNAEVLDLRDYFGKKSELSQKLDEIDMVWVSGGNTFVLRQAMRLSGFDELIDDLIKRKNFVYGGYSAGCCVLSPSLETLKIVDEPNDHPYEGFDEIIWDGLGLIDYAFMPHYDSDHPETDDIALEIRECEKNNIPYKAVRDGEVVLVEECLAPKGGFSHG